MTIMLVRVEAQLLCGPRLMVMRYTISPSRVVVVVVPHVLAGPAEMAGFPAFPRPRGWRHLAQLAEGAAGHQALAALQDCLLVVIAVVAPPPDLLIRKPRLEGTVATLNRLAAAERVMLQLELARLRAPVDVVFARVIRIWNVGVAVAGVAAVVAAILEVAVGAAVATLQAAEEEGAALLFLLRIPLLESGLVLHWTNR
jgi:hypothetical protein